MLSNTKYKQYHLLLFFVVLVLWAIITENGLSQEE